MARSLIDILAELFFALGLTILIEWGLSCFFVRSKSDQQVVILAQCITNPFINAIIIANGFFNVIDPAVLVIILELLVIVVEAIIYQKAFSKQTKINPFIFSASLNIISFSIGKLIELLVR